MTLNNLEHALSEINPMVCYNSRIKMLNRMMSNMYDKALKPYGLTGNQFTLLLFIGKTKSTNQKMIADMLMINFSTVSRDLNKLDIANWVIINKGMDARNTKISLSPKGLTLLATVLPVWKKTNSEVQVLFGDKISAGIDHMINTLRNSK
jgi:DNA-binding MarR family transcriptional regulator